MNDSFLLIGTALSLGFLHTILGPDHYLPFVAMAKARQWNMRKTVFITFLCGLGHVLSSIVLGAAGIIFGVTVFKLEVFESLRGDFAAWLLLAFGFTYFIWGLHNAFRSKPHTHVHYHGDDGHHRHSHCHDAKHMHLHDSQAKGTITPWVLFTIFVFGPCEPLIPILMYPAAQGSTGFVIAVTTVFSIATIATMLGIVILSSYGLAFISVPLLQRYSHAAAGLVIFLCGGAIKFFGL